MPTLGLVTDAHAGWQAKTLGLVPGAHVAVFTGQADVGLEGRLLGLEMRDALLVLRPGPSTGLIFLFRKPCEESTVAAQVLKTGTGGINVDGCRVTADRSEFFSATGRPRSGVGHAKGYGIEGEYGGEHANPPHEGGRWPPNVLMVHASECRREGTKRVKGSAVSKTFHGAYDGESNTGLLRGWSHPGNQHADEDGLETVSAWECGFGCPVPILDALSGDMPSSFRKARTGHNDGRNSMAGEMKNNGESFGHHDSGGASRFYPQFVDEDELRAWVTRLITPP